MTQKKTRDQQPSRLPKWFWAVLTACIVGVVMVAFYVFYLMSGRAAYDSAYRKCGGAPIEASGFAGGRNYYLLGDSGYTKHGGPLVSSYFCSESEAKSAGYERPQRLEK